MIKFLVEKEEEKKRDLLWIKSVGSLCKSHKNFLGTAAYLQSSSTIKKRNAVIFQVFFVVQHHFLRKIIVLTRNSIVSERRGLLTDVCKGYNYGWTSSCIFSVTIFSMLFPSVNGMLLSQRIVKEDGCCCMYVVRSSCCLHSLAWILHRNADDDAHSIIPLLLQLCQT